MPYRGTRGTCAGVSRLVEPIVTARVLVVVAHPDDETIGAGALLLRSTDANVVVVTDGAPRDRNLWPAGIAATTREQYAELRREELRGALGKAGIGAERIHHLGIADCEAVLQIPQIVNRLVELMDALQPTIVLTHAYEGAHVDHDATAFCVHLAMHISGRGHPHELALYHGAGETIVAHEFLPGGPPGETLTLDERLQARKAAMLGHYESQQQYAKYFGTAVERYRCAPAYDFRQEPQPGTAPLYERSGAGITGDGWRAQARAALDALNLGDWLDREGAASTASVEAAAPDRAPLVSIIVRTIGRNTLSDALASIRSQTYPNIEIVLVDVAGHGAPASWDSRPGLSLRVRPARGFDRAKAANAGLDGATGRYIAFLDDDDWLHADHLDTLVHTIEAASDARVAYVGVEVVEWTDRAPTLRWVFDAAYDPIALLSENFIPLNGMLVDRGLIDAGIRFDESLPIYEDWDFLIALSRRTTFAKASAVTAVYRWPPGSGVTDPQRTGPSQERVYAKWRPMLSDAEHVALMRRTIAQTTLNDSRQADIETLQRHLRNQDAELDRLRSQVTTQDQQLGELHRHLAEQDTELERLRPCVAEQEKQLEALRPHLTMQDRELEHLRALTSAREREFDDAQHRMQAQAQELDWLRTRVTTQAAQVDVLLNARAAADAERAAVLDSNSWRITRPLRAARAWVIGLTIRKRSTPRKS